MSTEPVPEKSKYKSSRRIKRISCSFKPEKYVEKNQVENQKNQKSANFGILFSEVQIIRPSFSLPRFPEDRNYGALVFLCQMSHVLFFFFPCIFFLCETKRDRVDAVALPSRFRPVFKYMPEVASAARADNLYPFHEIAVIFMKPDPVTGNHIIETRPASPGFKLGIRGKELLPTCSTGIDSFFFVVVQVARKWSFCAFLPQNMVLFGC